MHTGEEEGVTPPEALVPGQHQYTNPLESTGITEVRVDITLLSYKMERIYVNFLCTSYLTDQFFQLF
jgi:hypothetical protein